MTRLASELSRAGTPRAAASDIFSAVSAVYRRSRGGFAVVAMIVGHGLLGFRDPHGIRPLVIGRRETPQGNEYMLASESVALDQIGFELMRDVGPGEAVFIDEHGRFYSQQCVPVTRHKGEVWPAKRENPHEINKQRRTARVWVAEGRAYGLRRLGRAVGPRRYAGRPGEEIELELRSLETVARWLVQPLDAPSGKKRSAISLCSGLRPTSTRCSR